MKNKERNIQLNNIESLQTRAVSNTETLPLTDSSLESSFGMEFQFNLNRENVKKFANVTSKFSIVENQLLNIEKSLGGYVFSAHLNIASTITNVVPKNYYTVPFTSIDVNQYFDIYNNGSVGFKLKDGVTLLSGHYNFRFNYNLVISNINVPHELIMFKLNIYNSESSFLNAQSPILSYYGKELDVYIATELHRSGEDTISFESIQDLTNDASNTYFIALVIYIDSTDGLSAIGGYDITYNPNWLLETTSITSEKTQREINEDLQTQITSNDTDITSLQNDKADITYVDNQDAALQTQITSNDDDIASLQTETSNLQSQIDTINQLLIDYQLPIGTKVINNLNSDITNGGFKYGTWTYIGQINNNETIVASDNTSEGGNYIGDIKSHNHNLVRNSYHYGEESWDDSSDANSGNRSKGATDSEGDIAEWVADRLDVTSTGTDKNYPAGLQIGVSYVWKRTA